MQETMSVYFGSFPDLESLDYALEYFSASVYFGSFPDLESLDYALEYFSAKSVNIGLLIHPE